MLLLGCVLIAKLLKIRFFIIGALRDERTRRGIKILLEVPRSTKKLNKVFYQI